MKILVGWKAGMTRVFTSEGGVLPVTVIGIAPSRVVRIVRHPGRELRQGVQVEVGRKAADRRSGRGRWTQKIREFAGGRWSAVGDDRTVELLSGIRKVDVTGLCKGKGFAGTVKRWGFSTQDSTHGNSLSHRAPGAIGQNQSPGRVLKGKKMAGHLGGTRVTVQNLDVVEIDVEHSYLLVRGSVPGPSGGELLVREAVKSAR